MVPRPPGNCMAGLPEADLELLESAFSLRHVLPFADRNDLCSTHGIFTGGPPYRTSFKTLLPPPHSHWNIPPEGRSGVLITDSCAGLLSSFKLNNPARCCGPWRLWAQGVRRGHCPCSAFPFSQARGLASPPASPTPPPPPRAETPETVAVLRVSLSLF